MSQEHYLAPNHKCEFPTRIVAVDTEAWTKKYDIQKLRLGHAMFLRWRGSQWQEEHFPFATVGQFHDWMDGIIEREGNKNRIWLMSHNMKYDFPMLCMDSYLDGRFDAPDLFVMEPFLYYAKHKAKGTGLRVISTTNWYPFSLEKTAKNFGSFKLTSPDFTTSDWEVSDEDMAIYCRQDTVALSAIIKGHINFIRSNDLGMVQPTSASQAFNAFRHRFMKTPLLVHHRPLLVNMELESYHGGRVEAFQLGKVPDVYYLDVNSMYPAVMKGNQYPTVPRMKAPFKLFCKTDVPTSYEDDYIIARCWLDLKVPWLAVKRDDGKLIFPIGHVKATLSDPEYRYILEHPEVGTISKLTDFIAYEKASIFDEYVDFFYSLKRNAQSDLERSMAKLFLNSLYGKFGQRYHAPIQTLSSDEGTKDWVLVKGMLEDDQLGVVHENGRTYIRMGDKVVMQDKDVKGAIAEQSMPRISSAVTAYARLKLWEYMDMAGLENCFYCDTDSIMTNEDGYENLSSKGMVDASELGKLKMEFPTPVSVEVFGSKFYEVEGVLKCKGLKKNAKRVGVNSWEQDQFETGMNRLKNRINDGVRVSKLTKTFSKEYDKGTVLTNNRVVPFQLSQW